MLMWDWIEDKCYFCIFGLLVLIGISYDYIRRVWGIDDRGGI